MEKKIKFSLSQNSGFIVSAVFGFCGLLYGLIGILTSCYPTEDTDPETSLVFSILGFIFFAIAVILFFCQLSRKRSLQNIVNNGQHIWGEIVDIIPNYTVRINDKCGFTVLVRYVDRQGKIHIFRSLTQKKYPDRSIIAKQVKIYYENDTFHRYYVDLEGVLPTVIEH